MAWRYIQLCSKTPSNAMPTHLLSSKRWQRKWRCSWMMLEVLWASNLNPFFHKFLCDGSQLRTQIFKEVGRMLLQKNFWPKSVAGLWCGLFACVLTNKRIFHTAFKFQMWGPFACIISLLAFNKFNLNYLVRNLSLTQQVPGLQITSFYSMLFCYNVDEML